MPKPLAASRAAFTQQSLFPEPEKPKPIPRPVDPIREKLEALGFNIDGNGGCVTGWSEESNMHLGWGSNRELPLPWRLPSRLFLFPVHFIWGDGFDDDDDDLYEERPGKLILSHPLLGQHPFVLKLEELMNVKMEFEEDCNAFGVGENGMWHHAVDLCHEDNWRGLMNTRQFTSDSYIARAVEIALGYGTKVKPQLATASARRMLVELGHVETPADDWLTCFDPPKSQVYEKRTTWPIHAVGLFDAEKRQHVAWALVHGIEQGVFGHSGNSLFWTPKGVELYQKGNHG